MFHVVLYHPEIPHNAGAIGRTCVAVGAKLWMIRPLGFQINDYYLRRAGLDYWQHLNWAAVDDFSEVVDQLPGSRFWYFSKSAKRVYTQICYAPGDVFVFGSESSGLPPEMLLQNAGTALTIPMRKEVRSLNLSNAAAIVLYEALRQETAT